MSHALSIQDIEHDSMLMIEDHLDDWVIMAEEVFGVELDDEQKKVLWSCQYSPRTSIRSGTSRGKDFVAAVAAMCFMYTTPTWKQNGEMDENTKVFLIAPSERQVEDIMFPEISRLFSRARARGFNLPGRLVGLGIRTDFKEWFMTGFKADSHSVVAWTGLHAANIMFIVTEASGLAQLVFDGIEGNCHGNYRFVLAFNDNTGTGFASSTQKKKDWNKFTLDCLNAPNVVKHKEILAGTVDKIPGQVDWEGVNDKVNNWCQVISPEEFKEEEADFWWENEKGKLCYRPNDLFRVKVRGLSPKESSGSLVPKVWIEIANRNWKANVRNDKASLRLGVDVAGMGRDSSSFCYRYDNYVKKFHLIQSGGVANHMEVAGMTRAELDAHTVKAQNLFPQAYIDTIGEGAGVYSRLIEMHIQGVHSVKASASSKDENDQPLTDVTKQRTFKNMRAYLYWAIRDWLDPKNRTGAALPPDDELYEELSETQWKFRSDGSIELESKDDLKVRLKRSPDKADSLALTFYPAGLDQFDYDALNEMI